MKYTDENDKCYGLAGMAIGLSIWNGEDMLHRIDLDDEDGGYISFTSDFYFQGNPALPPVEAWHSVVKHYRMAVGMQLANMMCRAMSAGRTVDYAAAKKAVFAPAAEEGRRVCQLEDDEIRQLFQETYGYLERVFRNETVRTLARHLAERLRESRSLSSYEVKELLGMLDDAI